MAAQLPDGAFCTWYTTSRCLNAGWCAVRCMTSPRGIPKVTPDCGELSLKQVRGDVNVCGVHLRSCFLPLVPKQAHQRDGNPAVLPCLCLRSWVADKLVPRRRDAALRQPADQLLSVCPKPKTCTSAPGTALASGGVSLVRLPVAHEIFHEVLRVR